MNKNGVTLIILVITLVIMAILSTIVVMNVTDIYGNSEKVKLQNEIVQLELLTNNYIKRNPNFNWETVELDLSKYTENEKDQFNDEFGVNPSDKLTLYIVDLEEIDAEEVIYGDSKMGTKDRYLYSKTTQKIYYDLGILIDDEVYHRGDN